MEVSSLPGFTHDPETVWAFEREFVGLLDGVEPNLGHRSLAELEAEGILVGIVTQNVDGLHQAAGSKRVVELHGSEVHGICLNLSCGLRTPMAEILGPAGVWGCDLALRGAIKAQLQRLNRKKGVTRPGKKVSPVPSISTCSSSSVSEDANVSDVDDDSLSSSSASSSAGSLSIPSTKDPKDDALENVPMCPHCRRGVLKPDGVYFGEMMPHGPMNEAIHITREASLVLMVGTRGNVEPARQLPLMAKHKQGAKIVEINPHQTLLSKHAHLRLTNPSAKVLPELTRRALALRAARDRTQA